MFKGRRFAIGVVAAFALVVTAATGSYTSAEAATTSSGAPIKVGLICTCSGAIASVGSDIPDTYGAFVKSVNATGGINGHRIQLFFKDDGSSAATSVQDAQQLVSSDHIVALVDATNFDEAWASYVKTKGVPVVGLNTSTQPMFTNSDFYPEGQTEDALLPSIVAAAKTDHAANIGLMYCAEAVQCQEGIAPLKTAAAAKGLPLKYTAEISATAPNYTAQCVAAQQAGVKSVFIGDVVVVANKVASDCATQGYTPTYLLDGENLNSATLTAPGIKDNLALPVPNLPYFVSSPAVKAMNTALDKYYPGMRENATNWTEYDAEAWPSGLMLEDAVKAGGLKAGGTPSSAEIVKGLSALKGDTLKGWAPPLTFTPGKAHPVDCWFTATVKNGKFGLPNGTRTTCEGR